MIKLLQELWSKKGRLRALLFAISVLILVACGGGSAPDEPLYFSGGTMGTNYTVTVYAPAAERLALEVGIQRTLNRVVNSMSVYEPGSDISRFNAAPTEEWVSVSEEVAYVVQTALEVAERSGGAFEPTILPLVNIWGFGPQGRAEEVPSEAELAEAMSRLGWQAVEVRQEPPALLKRAEREIDLAAIAKGYGADAVAEYLLSKGYTHFLVELGGDMNIQGGKPDGSPWRIAIEEPVEHRRSIHRILEVQDAALVTSGDYRNYFEQEGVRFSHTIDPQTGRPVEHRLASVSVIAENGTIADAWATALLALGPEGALEMIEQEGLSALLIERTDDGFVETATGEFSRLLAEGESEP